MNAFPRRSGGSLVIPSAICSAFGIPSCFGISGSLGGIGNWQRPRRKWLAFAQAWFCWLCEMGSYQVDFQSCADSFRHCLCL